MTDKTYEEGLRDGAIQAIEKTQGEHHDRLNSHSNRLARMERILYIGLGALMILQALPTISATIKTFSQ